MKGFPTFLAHFLGEVLILVYLNFAAICFVDEKARENSNIKKRYCFRYIMAMDDWSSPLLNPDFSIDSATFHSLNASQLKPENIDLVQKESEKRCLYC